MARLGNPLVYHLPDIAILQAALEGRRSLRRAAMRRVVGDACYAVFHALCFVCASSLVGRNRTGTHEPIDRSVEHGIAKSRPRSREAGEIGPTIPAIGAGFAQLQDAGHPADCSPPGLPVGHDETLNPIARAKQVITLIEDLSPVDRLRLAILLIARPR